LQELIFVGLGLNSERGLTLGGLEETKSAESVFLELYTSLLPDFSIENLERIVGKKVQLLSRRNLEEENGKPLFDAAKSGKTILLVPGDPFIATTHVALRIEAAKRKVPTRVIHGASIISAVIGFSGLHNYKFGKTVTIPFAENFSETPYSVIAQNKQLGLHTLCLMDLDQVKNRFMTINEAIAFLKGLEEKKRQGIARDCNIAVGLARAGSDHPVLKAGFIKELVNHDFGKPPMTLILPSQLHFIEAEALIAFADAPAEIRSTIK
jgi:diphthine synthase